MIIENVNGKWMVDIFQNERAIPKYSGRSTQTMESWSRKFFMTRLEILLLKTLQRIMGVSRKGKKV